MYFGQQINKASFIFFPLLESVNIIMILLKKFVTSKNIINYVAVVVCS